MSWLLELEEYRMKMWDNRRKCFCEQCDLRVHLRNRLRGLHVAMPCICHNVQGVHWGFLGSCRSTNCCVLWCIGSICKSNEVFLVADWPLPSSERMDADRLCWSRKRIWSFLECPIISTNEPVCDTYFPQLFFAKIHCILVIFNLPETYALDLYHFWFPV